MSLKEMLIRFDFLSVFSPAELLAAVRYFDQRQDREHNREQLQSDEVREKISFLELQAQVTLNISRC